MRKAVKNSAGLMNTTAVMMFDTKVTSKLNLLNAFNSTTTNHSGVSPFKKILPKVATVVTVVLLTLLGTSCATPPKYYLGVNTTIAEFSINENEDRTQCISILPANYPTGESLNAGERNYFSEQLNNNLIKRFEKQCIFSTKQTMDALNKAEVVEDYSELINNFKNIGIISKPKLKLLSESVNSRYFLYTQFVNTAHTSSQRLDNINYNINSKDVVMSYQLWDSKTSTPIFETTISTGAVLSNEINFNEIVAVNINAFAQELKNGTGINICPDCPQSITEYHRKIASANSQNYLVGILGGTLAGCLLILLIGSAGM